MRRFFVRLRCALFGHRHTSWTLEPTGGALYEAGIEYKVIGNGPCRRCGFTERIAA